MFDSPQDFQFVVGKDADDEHPNGDLDRIRLNGVGLMPFRSAVKDPLYGKDVAFLMEAWSERMLATDHSRLSEKFSRRLGSDGALGVISTSVAAYADGPLTSEWLNDGGISEEILDCGNGYSPWTDDLRLRFTPKTASIDFNEDGALRRDKVLSLFEDVSLFHRYRGEFYPPSMPGASRDDWDISGIPETEWFGGAGYLWTTNKQFYVTKDKVVLPLVSGSSRLKQLPVEIEPAELVDFAGQITMYGVITLRDWTSHPKPGKDYSWSVFVKLGKVSDGSFSTKLFLDVVDGPRLISEARAARGSAEWGDPFYDISDGYPQSEEDLPARYSQIITASVTNLFFDCELRSRTRW